MAGERLAAVAAVLGALGVALGAFGAHALTEVATPERVATWRTAASYHQVHALAGVAAGLLTAWRPSRAAQVSAGLFLAGTALFSGSLYVLVLTDIGVLGAVAPLGGLAFIAGWLALATALWRSA